MAQKEVNGIDAHRLVLTLEQQKLRNQRLEEEGHFLKPVDSTIDTNKSLKTVPSQKKINASMMLDMLKRDNDESGGVTPKGKIKLTHQ